MMKIVIVYNHLSGSDEYTKESLKGLIERYGHTVVDMYQITDDLTSQLDSYIVAGVHIAAYGGDGTISKVASLIAGSQAVLIALPGGTLNHFARDIYGEATTEEIVRRLSDASMRVDAVSLNTLTFINNSSIGLYPDSLNHRKTLQPRFGKWPAAVIASLKALMRFQTYDVVIDDALYRTPFVFIGNNHYELSGQALGKRPTLDGSQLCVYIAHATSRWKLFIVCLQTIFGRVQDVDDLTHHDADYISIEFRHHSRVKVSHDGELTKLATPLIYEIKPGALLVSALHPSDS